MKTKNIQQWHPWFNSWRCHSFCLSSDGLMLALAAAAHCTVLPTVPEVKTISVILQDQSFMVCPDSLILSWWKLCFKNSKNNNQHWFSVWYLESSVYCIFFRYQLQYPIPALDQCIPRNLFLHLHKKLIFVYTKWIFYKLL